MILIVKKLWQRGTKSIVEMKSDLVKQCPSIDMTLSVEGVTLSLSVRPHERQGSRNSQVAQGKQRSSCFEGVHEFSFCF